MNKKTTRPLNKKEQKLFARLYLGNIASLTDSISGISGLSENEVEGIGEALLDLADKLMGEHAGKGSSSGIIAQIKACRK